MDEISPQISSILTSYSEFTGQNDPVLGQGFYHGDRELIDRSGFKLYIAIRARPSQAPIFEFLFV